MKHSESPGSSSSGGTDDRAVSLLRDYSAVPVPCHSPLGNSEVWRTLSPKPELGPGSLGFIQKSLAFRKPGVVRRDCYLHKEADLGARRSGPVGVEEIRHWKVPWPGRLKAQILAPLCQLCDLEHAVAPWASVFLTIK